MKTLPITMYKLTCRGLHTYACDEFLFVLHPFYVYVCACARACVCVRVGMCAGEWAFASVLICICTVYR